MTAQRDNLPDSVRLVLELYKELGFERLPLDSVCESREVCRRNSPAVIHRSPSDKEAALKALRMDIGDCTRCKLSRGRTNIVFGEGSVDAGIMFIGEAPGREEDMQGRPFVGDAGQLLTKLIEKMGFKREEVYIANIVKCRPPMNRDPQGDEISACLPFLEKQIEIISPCVIVSLGKFSAYTLLGVKSQISKFSITRVRGKFGEYRGIPLMPTFHPAYLLRNPKDKWLTWEDAQAALKKLDECTMQ